METDAAVESPEKKASALQADYDFLRACSELADSEAAAIVRWWSGARLPQESLLDFLVRHELLTSRERKLIEIANPHLSRAARRTLFPHAAQTRIRNRAAEHIAEKKTRRSTRRIDEETDPADETFGAPPKTIAAPAQKANANNSVRDFIGAKVGRVLIDCKLGEGGYGVVYRGHHERLDVGVAVKFLRCQRNQLTQKILDRLIAEARLMAKLNHINVVRLWDFDDEHDPPYLMMEYVDGSSVHALLEMGGRLPGRASLKIIREVARGLRVAAQIGVVHRDVKPANILIGPDGVAKITDFGLAMLADDPSAGQAHLKRKESGVCGTAEYVAPDHMQGSPASHQSDMYSLGATLYHMIVGRPPFEGGTNLQILHNAATKPVMDPCKLAPSIDARLGRFTCRLLAKTASERFANYDEMFIEVDEMLGRRN